MSSKKSPLWYYIIWLDVVTFGDFGVQFFNIGESANKTGGTTMGELAMKNELGFGKILLTSRDIIRGW